MTQETKGSAIKADVKTESLKPEVPNTVAVQSKRKDLLASLKGSVSVKPHIDGGSENMGLEDYGMVIFPGTYQEEQIAAIERNGVVRYITGLDEFAAEVQNIDDDEKREAVIYNIRLLVADLEKKLATNVLNVEDPDFWNKVKLLRPDNHKFWEKISLRCGNEPLFLEPKKDPYDLIKMIAIEAGGFDLVAKSYEDAKLRAKPPKWYLDKEEDTVSTRTEVKKIKNKAKSILESLYNKNPKKLLYITKVIDTHSSRYKATTPPDTLYDVMDEYIEGNGVEMSVKKASQYFIDISNLDMETLKLKSIVKDATFYKFIVAKPDGMLYHSKSSSMLGRNVTDVVEYLKNPLHEDILNKILVEVETYWK